MQTHNWKSKKVMLLSVLLVLVVSAIAIMATRRETRKAPQQETKWVTETLPTVVSQVPNIEVVNSYIENRGKPGAEAAIEIRNNSNKGILEITVVSGDKTNSTGLTSRIEDESDASSVLVAPYGTYTIHWSVGEIMADLPIRVAGVLYVDGSEAGEDTTLGTMRGQREHDKAERSARKGVTTN